MTSSDTGPCILQVGLGNFGKRHLEAWHRLGLGERLWIVEPDERKWAETVRFRFPASRLLRRLDGVLERASLVDVVTPTDTHFALCQQALRQGKDVFVEKPMTLTSAEARELVELATARQRLIQVGFYYRYHPASQQLKTQIQEGRLGRVRYLSGNFMGFKRARNDVGVMHTDGIHFLDLFNWLAGSAPSDVYAVCRDHFQRGLEDFAIALLTYPSGVVAKVEAGYIQPGRWNDKVVAGAMTTKEIMVVGDRAAAEIDFETETLTWHDAHHELRDGVWTALVGASTRPPLAPCDPVQMVCRELENFLRSVETRQVPMAGGVESGLQLAVLMERLYESAKQGMPMAVETESAVARAAAA